MEHSTNGRVVGRRWRRRSVHLFWTLMGVVVCGCGSQADVRHYRVPKPELVYAENHVLPADKQEDTQTPAQASQPTDRMLGAIVPQAARTWYFKMTGPEALVAQQEPAFRQLVESLTFAAVDSPPQWTLPASWKEERGSGARYATLIVPGDAQPLEVSVSELPMDGSPTSILQNINRWRRQLQLPPIAPDQLQTETQTLALADREAVYVNLVGTLDKSGGPPMMGGQ